MVRYKEDGITLLVVLTVFLFFVFTPGKETLGSAIQGFIMALIFFSLLPLGYHFLVLKKDRESFGIEKGSWRYRTILIIPSIVLALLITILCFQLFPAFQQRFFLPPLVTQSFGWFLGYELLLAPLLLAFYEIFFRGFIQKSWLENHWGGLAILIQGILFIVFLLMTGSLGWATFPLVLISFFSGFLLWQNGSLIQSWVTSWLYLMLFDVFLLVMR